MFLAICTLILVALFLIGGRILFYKALDRTADTGTMAILDIVLCIVTFLGSFWILGKFQLSELWNWLPWEIVLLWGVPAGFGIIVLLAAKDEPDDYKPIWGG